MNTDTSNRVVVLTPIQLIIQWPPYMISGGLYNQLLFMACLLISLNAMWPLFDLWGYSTNIYKNNTSIEKDINEIIWYKRLDIFRQQLVP